MPSEHSDVVRFYTRGRRIPFMLGRLPDGTRLWGGPYTSVQAVGAGATLAVLWLTLPLWGRLHLGMGTAVVLLGGPVGVTFGMRKVRLGGRSPRSVAAGVVAAYLQPAAGRLRGEKLPRPRTTKVRGRVVLGVPRDTAPTTRLTVPTASMPVAAPVPKPVVTGQRRPRSPAPATQVTPVPARAPHRVTATPATRALTNLERLLATADDQADVDPSTRSSHA